MPTRRRRRSTGSAASSPSPSSASIYNGKVVKVVDFGAFVNFLGSRDGLVHISELAPQRVGKVADVVKVGDQVKVKVLGFDDRGKVKLSMRQVDQETGEDLGDRRQPAAEAASRQRSDGRSRATGPRSDAAAASPAEPAAGDRPSRRGRARAGEHACRLAPRQGARLRLGRVRRAADRRRRARAAATTTGSTARPTARPRLGTLPLAAIRGCRCRRAGSPRLRRRAACRRSDEALASLARARPGANIEIKAERGRAGCRAPAAAVVGASRPASTGSAPPSSFSFLRDGARRVARSGPATIPRGLLFGGLCPRDWADDRRAARLHDDQCRPRRLNRRAVPRRSAPPAIRCSPIRSTTRQRARRCSTGGSTSVFSDVPDIILRVSRSGPPVLIARRRRRRRKEHVGEAAQSAGDFRARGAAAGRGRQGHLGLERRKLGRLGGLRRRRHVLRASTPTATTRAASRSRRSITAAPGASGTRSWSPTRSPAASSRRASPMSARTAQGRIHMNVLWEMAAAERVLHGVLEGARGLIHGVTCGAGMPYQIAEICARYGVHYYPIVSSARAFRALWKRAYHKFRDWLGGVVYEDPWLAGGHNGLSNSEDPEAPEPPYPRVRELRSLMREFGLDDDADLHGRRRVVSARMGRLDRQSRARADRLPVRHAAAADPGKPDLRRVEAQAADAEGGRRLSQPLQPDRLLFLGRAQRLSQRAAASAPSARSPIPSSRSASMSRRSRSARAAASSI